MHKIKGTYCAALTPLHEDFTINKKLFLNHCQNLLSQELDGLGIFGSTGEANSLSVNEKIETINFLVNNKVHPNKLIPGTGQCSIKDTILFTKESVRLKTKAVLVLPPFYYKNVKDDGVINYYRRIIEEVGDSELQYILYNIPQISGVSIGFNIIEQLKKYFPKNFSGMKDSSGDIDNMLKIIKYFDDFSLFCGSDSLALKVCRRGGAGAITASSNISGKLLSYILNNYKNESQIKDFNLLQQLQEKIRETLFSHEPISALKAYLSIINNNQSWNIVAPPLIKISNPENHKTIISLIELTKKINILIPHS